MESVVLGVLFKLIPGVVGGGCRDALGALGGLADSQGTGPFTVRSVSGKYGISPGFTGIGTKLGALYLDTEVSNEPSGRGTATPLEELSKVPEDIELTEGKTNGYLRGR
jgi:hypothetical protein